MTDRHRTDNDLAMETDAWRRQAMDACLLVTGSDISDLISFANLVERYGSDIYLFVEIIWWCRFRKKFA